MDLRTSCTFCSSEYRIWERQSQWAPRDLMTLLWHVRDDERRGPTWGEPFYVQANGLSLQPGGLPRQFLRGLQITCHNPNIFLFLLSWSLISVVTLPWWATARVLKRLQESSNMWYKHDQHSLLFTWNDEIFRQLLISSRQLKNSVIIGINIQLMLPNIF